MKMLANFHKSIKFFLTILVSIILLPIFVDNSFPATYYIAPPAGGPGGSGTIDDPWHDLNYALNRDANGGSQARVRPGDTLYLRGGVYNVANMTRVSHVNVAPMIKLENTSLSSPATTIKSYPGEWAILDGGNVTSILQGYAGGRQHNIIFENFEVRNGKSYEGGGLVFGNGHDPIWLVNSTFRNLYIHNNGYTGPDDNPAGLHLSGENCIVEYCTFENNGLKDVNGNPITSSNWNPANLMLFDCYNTTLGSIDPYPRKNNIIRYNKFIGSNVGLKDKGANNFVNMLLGYNNALTDRHPEWANEIHHNVFLNNKIGYLLLQDFVKVHHNIFIGSGSAILAYEYQPTGVSNPPLIWEPEIYNNTFHTNGHDVEIWDSPYNYTYGGYNWRIYNNLSIAPSGSPFCWFSYRGTSSLVYPMEEDHNGIDSSTGKSFGYYQGSNKTLTQWKTIVNPRTGTYTLGANDIYSPLQVNSDYTLASNSSSRGVGRNGSDLGAVPYGTTSWYSQTGFQQQASSNLFAPSVAVQSVTNP